MARWLILLMFVLVSGCTTVKYKPVPVDPALTSPNACPTWPRARVSPDELGVSEYMIEGYRAYVCERKTRLSIK